jgi:hypothetical protein
MASDMPLPTTRNHQRDFRDTTFPLRRKRRFYTTDLRFMAQRRRFRRAISVYEFAGINHRECQLWRLCTLVPSWSEAAEAVDASRRRAPLSTEPPTPEILEMPLLLADSGG